MFETQDELEFAMYTYLDRHAKHLPNKMKDLELTQEQYEQLSISLVKCGFIENAQIQTTMNGQEYVTIMNPVMINSRAYNFIRTYEHEHNL